MIAYKQESNVKHVKPEKSKPFEREQVNTCGRKLLWLALKKIN